MNFRRQTGDLTTHDQVDVEIESIGFQCNTITFLHRPHFGADVARGLVQGLGRHDRLARRLVIRQDQIVIDQRKCRLSERKVARSHDANDSFARFFVNPHLAAHGNIIHAGAGARIRQKNRACAAKHAQAIRHERSPGSITRPCTRLI